jgi:hypothetical protein
MTLSQATINLGTIADSAWSALQSSPSPQTATAYHDAMIAYSQAVYKEFQSQIDAANGQVTTLQQQLANTVPLATLQQAEATINQLQAKLQQAGIAIVPAPGGGVTTTPSPGTAVPQPGTYTAGQVGAATVGGALVGWLASTLWRDHESKVHARGSRVARENGR